MLLVGCSTTKDNKTAESSAPKEESVKEEAANEEAANEETVKGEVAEDEPQETDVVGIRMDLSEVAANAKGALLPYPIGVFDDDRNIYAMPIYYIAMPKEEASAILYDTDASAEETKKLNERQTIVHVIVASAVDYDQTLKVLSEKLEINSPHLTRNTLLNTISSSKSCLM